MPLRTLSLTAILTLVAWNAGAADTAARLEAAPVQLGQAPAECTSPDRAMFLTDLLPEPILSTGCGAVLTCHNGSTVACGPFIGTCSVVPSDCPSQAGYVQCGSSRDDCPPCPDVPPPPADCVVNCSVNSDCTAHCGGPGVCVNGCPPKPTIKKCVCLA
jgi:hypothetical protein